MSKKSLVLLVPSLILALAWLAGCGGGGSTDPITDVPEKPFVVATTGMVGDLAQRIAGDHARVETLMGPGVDPHLYKASESDVRRLDQADLILYNGLHLEGKMTEILGKMARGKKVVAVAESVDEARLLSPPEFEGAHDPHIWFDVSLWVEVIDPALEALIEVDAAHAEDYRANAEAYRAELIELDGWVAEQVAALPPDQRVLVTAHDAFGYFGQRYGFEVVGLQGLSTATEAGLKDVDRVVNLVVDRQLKAIFVESSVPAKSIEAVRPAPAEKGREVALGGELFSDAMGSEGTPEGTYVGMVRHNVDTVVGALR